MVKRRIIRKVRFENRKPIRSDFEVEDNSAICRFIDTELQKVGEKVGLPGKCLMWAFNELDIKPFIRRIIEVQHRMIDFPNDWKQFAFEKVPVSDEFHEEDYGQKYKEDLFYLREMLEDAVEMEGFRELVLG